LGEGKEKTKNKKTQIQIHGKRKESHTVTSADPLDNDLIFLPLIPKSPKAPGRGKRGGVNS
jgi:hypothetical protein